MGLEYRIDQTELRQKLGAILRNLENARPAFERIGEIVFSSVQQNFEDGGRPDRWPPLSPATKKDRLRVNKWPGRILVRQGTAGGLLGSINYQASDDRVIVSAGKKYAAIQHFGGLAGRGRKVRIPARPFLMVQDEDWEDMLDAMEGYLFQGRP